MMTKGGMKGLPFAANEAIKQVNMIYFPTHNARLQSFVVNEATA